MCKENDKQCVSWSIVSFSLVRMIAFELKLCSFIYSITHLVGYLVEYLKKPTVHARFHFTLLGIKAETRAVLAAIAGLRIVARAVSDLLSRAARDRTQTPVAVLSPLPVNWIKWSEKKMTNNSVDIFFAQKRFRSRALCNLEDVTVININDIV